MYCIVGRSPSSDRAPACRMLWRRATWLRPRRPSRGAGRRWTDRGRAGVGRRRHLSRRARRARESNSSDRRCVERARAGTAPYPHFFPLRNRISGPARAVVVIEVGDKSGSLITARTALDQRREVLTVPGNVLTERNPAPTRRCGTGQRSSSRPTISWRNSERSGCPAAAKRGRPPAGRRSRGKGDQPFFKLRLWPVFCQVRH